MKKETSGESKKIGKSIPFLQLNDYEHKIINKINLLSKEDTAKIEDILLAECKDMASFVRLAIYNPNIRQWCRLNQQSTWEEGLQELGEGVPFEYQFRAQKNLSAFDLLAGSILINESLKYEEQSVKHIFILLATQLFHSFYATFLLTDHVLTELKDSKEQKIIESTTNILETAALIHGCPGYVLYSVFNFKLCEFFLKKKLLNRAAAAMHLSYRFLLTAISLEKHCSAELSNALYGKNFSLFNLKLNEQKGGALFFPIRNFYKNHYSDFIDPIDLAAQQEASRLAAHWISSTKK